MISTKGRTLLLETENVVVVVVSSLCFSSEVFFSRGEKSEREISSSKKESSPSQSSASGSPNAVEAPTAVSEILISRRGLPLALVTQNFMKLSASI